MKQIAAGSGHSCAVMAKDGAVWCWGSNALGSVGVKSPHPRQQYHATPQRVGELTSAELAIIGVKTCITKADGGLACWGGSLGDDDARPEDVMLPVRGRLRASAATGCIVSPEGTATCWGKNESGRLSPGTTVSEPFGREQGPAPLDIGAPIRDIAIGGRHGCALLTDGQVTCWGLGNFGQLGAGERSSNARGEPAVVAGLKDVKQLVSGYFHSCALEADGTVWCWGRGDDGQLGIGAIERQSEFDDDRYAAKPTEVKGLSGVTAVFASGSATCAITASGELWCWGNNDKGQVGDGTSEDRFEPVRVEGLGKVTAVAIGHSHKCALVEPGDVYCWGDGEDGKLGTGSVEASPTPTRVKLAAAPGAGSTAAAASAAAGKPGELRDYESLACGFRVRLPGVRAYQQPDDLTVDFIWTGGPFWARCTRRDKMADKDIDALEARLQQEDRPPDVTLTRRKVGEASCLQSAGDQGVWLLCFTDEHFIRLAVGTPDPKLRAEIISSLTFFDRKAPFKAAAPPPSAPAGMVAIPAGEFAMGCANVSLLAKPTGELGCSEDSQPLHRVRLPAFAIDAKEVAWAEYQACVSAGECKPAQAPAWRDADQKPELPMRFVTWQQADRYCRWKGKRLPTEAEWEKAARGTDGRSRPWGEDETTCERAVLARCSDLEPLPVGGRPSGASPYSVLDMAGNVREWVADRYQKTYYLQSPIENPTGPATGIHHSIRGSSYKTFAGSEAVYHRRGKEPSHQAEDLGFRCAQSLGAAGPLSGSRSSVGTGVSGSCHCAVPRPRRDDALPWWVVAGLLGVALARRGRGHHPR